MVGAPTASSTGLVGSFVDKLQVSLQSALNQDPLSKGSLESPFKGGTVVFANNSPILLITGIILLFIFLRKR